MRIPYISVDLGSLFTGVFPRERQERCLRVEILADYFNIEVVKFKTMYGKRSFDKLRFGIELKSFRFSKDLKEHFKVGRWPILVGAERESLYRSLGIEAIPLDISVKGIKEVLNAFQNITGQKIPIKRHRGSIRNNSFVSGLWEEE